MVKIAFNSSRLLVALLLLVACAACVTKLSNGRQTLSADSAWVLLPMQNLSGYDLAGENTQALLETQLRAKGAQDVTLRRTGVKHTNLDALDSARVYAVSGKVLKWRYDEHTGRSAEVALELTIRDVADDMVVWQNSFAARGNGRATLTAVADTALKNMLAGVTLGATDTAKNTSVQLVTKNAAPSVSIPTVQAAAAIASPLQVNVSTTDITMAGKSVAVYYADNPPVETLAQFDRLILEPDNIDSEELQVLLSRGATAYAYLSIGEVGPTRGYANSIDGSWVLTQNPAWNSQVMDLANPGWQDFLIKRVSMLVDAGYQGLFMDTMDSYQLHAADPLENQRQQLGLATIVQKIKQTHPALRLIANRGFEVLPQIAQNLEAVAAESLYASWDNVQQEYLPVAKADRDWLLGKLVQVREEYGLDAIAIDYLPTSRRAEARATAATIAQHGVIPWISTPGFDSVGVGLLEVIPRKVLMLFDSRIHGTQDVASAHRLLATPIEYMGYVPEYLDLHTQALPTQDLRAEYAGVVSWTNQSYDNPLLVSWLSEQFSVGVPVAFFSSFGIPLDEPVTRAMGVAPVAPIDLKSATVSVQDELIGFEKPLVPRIAAVAASLRSQQSDNTVHLAYQDSNGQNADLVVTGPWGGYALNPAVVDLGVDNLAYWILDPFAFLKKALKLEDIPAPDVTTENGKRLWFAHIDGDALPSWAEMPGKRLGAEVIESRILERYKLPHTISVVEAEMTSMAVVDRRQRMFETMRRIFALDSVELASHSFSHPFHWGKVSPEIESGQYNMRVEGYRYSSEREVAGSIDFINQQLAPADKTVKVMLWSGNAVPQEDALRSAMDSGVLNMNGGFTFINHAMPALSQVTPMARTVGDYLQVYAPIMNENVYTNEWRGPFDGFRRVTETFELTEHPRRLKPINIYYHFYSGTKTAAMTALQEVYAASLQQDVMPVFGSYYIRKVQDFRDAGVARYLDGTWKLSALGNIRSLRVLDKQAWPQLAGSTGMAGARGLHDGNYLHTDGSDTVLFKLGSSLPTGLHLVSANGQLLHWTEQSQAVSFRLKSALPARLELGGSAAGLCRIKTQNTVIRGKRTADNTILFSFTSKDTGNASLDCGT